MLQEMELFLKTHKKAALLNVIAVCICYFHMAFSENIGIDTEALMINEPNMPLEGRGLDLRKSYLIWNITIHISQEFYF